MDSQTDDLIEDFLDKEDYLRKEGKYEFAAHEISYLTDIPEQYVYRITRTPSTSKKGIVDIYYSAYERRTSEVFSITKVNTPTYVSRKYLESQTYEATLELALEDPGQTVILHGHSKLGKSALWKSILDDEAIVVQCNNSFTIKDLYLFIVDSQGESFKTQIIEGYTSGTKDGMEASLIVGPSKGLQGTFKASSENSQAKKQEVTSRYVEKPITAQYICSLLRDRNIPIIFENYHRLNEQTLKDLSIDLRTFSDERINTIFVGIPTSPYQITEYNNELLGRVIFMKFNYWTEDELKKIAIGGEIVLNIGFEDKTLNFLAKESVGSPLLMQMFCFIACISCNVSYTQEIATKIKIDETRFEMAMKNYGRMFMAPCAEIWEEFKDECLKIKGLGLKTIEELSAFIKSDNVSLSTAFKNVFVKTSVSGIIKLIDKLNGNTKTVDFMTYEPKGKNISFGQPLLLVYIRWLDKSK